MSVSPLLTPLSVLAIPSMVPILTPMLNYSGKTSLDTCLLIQVSIIANSYQEYYSFLGQLCIGV